VIGELARWYFEQVKRMPRFVFMRRLPRGVENGTPIAFRGDEMMLFEAEWALDDCVMVGG
jgi:uncharacterized protein (DUF924 family)